MIIEVTTKLLVAFILALVTLIGVLFADLVNRVTPTPAVIALASPTEDTPTNTDTPPAIHTSASTETPLSGATATQSYIVTSSDQPTLSLLTTIPTDTPSAIFTSAPTNTLPIYLNSTPSDIAANTPMNTPTATLPRANLTIHRSADTIAICAQQNMDLSNLKVAFGPSTYYILGEIFLETTNAAAGNCWCLQQNNAIFPVPDVCGEHNTSIQNQPRDWRNPDIAFSIAEVSVGTCLAQPENRAIYFCEFVIGN